MRPLFQLSTRKYEEEIGLIRKAMIDLEKKCSVENGYEIGPPSSAAGWTFLIFR